MYREALPAGTVLEGRYRIIRELGTGSFAITYLARHGTLDRAVAIKELYPDGLVRQGGQLRSSSLLSLDEFRATVIAFSQEARVLMRCQQPNIVRVEDLFHENGTVYMVMEYIEGLTLANVLQRQGGPLPLADVVAYGVTLAQALEAVHAQGVIHRDITPANILVRASGQPVLIDFGAARPFVQQRTTPLTAIGTPGYAPLEQHGSGGRSTASSPATDVYGLAATLYHLATGRMPPSAPDRAIGEPLPPPRTVNPAISHALSGAIVAGLAIQPRDRPQTMQGFLDLLTQPGPSQPQATPAAQTRTQKQPTPRPRLRFCTNCGWKYGADDARFCTECGARRE